MISFHGASDDVIVLSHDGVAVEEYDCPNGLALFTLTERDTLAGFWLRLSYGEMGDHEGGWSAEIGLNGEGLLIPWDVTIGHHPRTSYTVWVQIDADPRLMLIERDETDR